MNLKEVVVAESRYYPGLYLEEHGEKHENLWISGVPAEIRKESLEKKSIDSLH
jgi:hypothetical protein